MAKSPRSSAPRKTGPVADPAETCTCGSAEQLRIARADAKRMEGMLRAIKTLIEQFAIETVGRQYNDWSDVDELETGPGHAGRRDH